MKNFTFNSAVSAIAVSAAIVALPASVRATNSNNGSDNPGNKVTICHATGSSNNPYVVIAPNVNGVINGHYGHQDSRDIIPSFSYKSHGVTKTFAGQNLANGGQSILDNGCVVSGGHGGGDNGGSNGGSGGGQVLGETVSTNAVGAVAAGAGGADAFTVGSLDRAW